MEIKRQKNIAKTYLMDLVDGGNAEMTCSALAILIEFSSRSDHEALALKLALAVSRMPIGSVDWLARFVAFLGREAWKYAVLIELVIRASQGKTIQFCTAIEGLISLLREKPADTTVPHPTIPEIAAMARRWLNEKDGSNLKGYACDVIWELSTFPEFRSVPSAGRPLQKGKGPR